MAHINEGVVDDNGPAHHDDDPGAYPFPFGPFAGKRLDTVPNRLRWWATRARQSNSWYAAYIKAHSQYEELLLQTPEAYPLPFGEHEGERLDEVPEHLIWWGVHPLRSHNAWYQNLAEANRLYLDKVYEKKTPGSVQIWFGQQYKGYRLDDVYKRPGFIRFCLKPEHHKYPWYYKFEDLVQRYEVHLQTHRRPYRPRKRAHVENPTGELLGKWNDDRGSAEPDDDYERDSFVVDDDDNGEEIYQEEGSNFESGNNTDDPAVGDDSDGQDKEDYTNSESTTNSDADGSVVQTERLSPSRASASASRSGSDSEDDIPLNELHNKIRVKHLSNKGKAKVVSSNNRRRSHWSSGEESDTTDQPAPKRLKRRSEHAQGADSFLSVLTTVSQSVGRPRPTPIPDSEPVAAVDETETPRHLQLQGKFVRRDDDDSDIPEYDVHTNAPSRLGRRYRALVQSDVEVL
ncbi:uncharacterized protein EDB91DRAFT_1114074 [Suillus paluster]|uniref:uncharacterized protein n=1 Tax=Suillus paluster TaxID=48578 RepID=UPI001B87F8A3|nr:uncharacterized protein EDB91DRAFT_1114074 [Suillus paluster]KAG1748453.1 hypothetical protein EDB91DRAFT_1114074 [Suillus paluster]